MGSGVAFAAKLLHPRPKAMGGEFSTAEVGTLRVAIAIAAAQLVFILLREQRFDGRLYYFTHGIAR